MQLSRMAAKGELLSCAIKVHLQSTAVQSMQGRVAVFCSYEEDI
jgi:hypothetical protein